MNTLLNFIIVCVFILFTSQLCYSQCPGPVAISYKKKMDNFNNLSLAEKSTTEDKTQGWAQLATWYAYKCNCDNKSDNTKESADKLVAVLNRINQTIKNLYSHCGSTTGVVSKCVYKGSNNQSFSNDSNNNSSNEANTSGINLNKPVVDSNSGVVVKDEYLDLLSNLAMDSKNIHFKEMVNSMNKTHKYISDSKEMLTLFGGATQDNIDFYNMTENIGQVVAVGKFIFDIFKKPKPAELSQNQKAVRSYIGELSKHLSLIHQETSAISIYYSFDKTTLKALEKKEELFSLFETATADKRLLFWEFQKFKGVPNKVQFQHMQQKIEQEKSLYGTSHLLTQIDNITSRFSNSKDFPHTLNRAKSFTGAINQIAVIKARCYKALGQNKKAEKILNSLDYNVDVNSAITLIQQAYSNDNYFLAQRYFIEIKNYLIDNNEVQLSYNKIYQLDHKIKGPGVGLPRYDMNYIISLGVMSYLKSGQITQAEEAFLFLEKYQNNFEVFYQNYLKLKPKKKRGYASDEEVKNYLVKAENINNAVEAVLSYKHQDYEKSLSLINNAIELDASSIHIRDVHHKYALWFKFIKADLLVKMGEYTKAKIVLKDIRKSVNFPSSYSIVINKGLKISDYNFLKTYIKFKQKNYNSALMGLKILKLKDPKVAKYYMLEADIYKLLGDTEKLEKAEHNYLQLITSKK